MNFIYISHIPEEIILIIGQFLQLATYFGLGYKKYCFQF